jgi:hypothetical protein
MAPQGFPLTAPALRQRIRRGGPGIASVSNERRKPLGRTQNQRGERQPDSRS